MSSSLILALSSVVAIFVEIFLAYQDEMLFPGQMAAKGYPIGFPLIANGGVWGDLLFVTPALFIIGKYTEKWSFLEMVGAFAISMAVSYAMHHFVYLKGTLPDALAGGGRPISPAGWVHVMYFATALTLIVLFYVANRAMTSDIVVIGVLLFLHIIVANHVPFHFINQHYNFTWCHDIYANEANPLQIIFWAGSLLGIVTLAKLSWVKIAPLVSSMRLW